jgi:hypothetical protein
MVKSWIFAAVVVAVVLLWSACYILGGYGLMLFLLLFGLWLAGADIKENPDTRQ